MITPLTSNYYHIRKYCVRQRLHAVRDFERTPISKDSVDRLGARFSYLSKICNLIYQISSVDNLLELIIFVVFWFLGLVFSGLFLFGALLG